MPASNYPLAPIVVASVACMAAVVAAGAAAYQVMTTRGDARQQLRAYVGARIEIKTGPNSEIFIWLENNGQTPARESRWFSSWHFIPATQQLPANFTFPGTHDCGEAGRSLGVLFPKTPLRTGNLLCSAIAPKIVQVQRNESTAILYGHVDYADVFDKPGRTQFCWMLTANTNSLCDRHNDVR
jgi:hypothetical protein